LKEHFRKIDDIGRTIEGMESSVDYLNVIISRIGIFLFLFESHFDTFIEGKFEELEKMG